jgi:hypothetical protein
MPTYKLTWDIVNPRTGKKEHHSEYKDGKNATEAKSKIYIHSSVGKAVNFKAKKVG